MALPSKPIDTTINYYDTNATAFIERTIDENLSEEYDAFLPHLPPVARILDAGCGSGRDARIFKDMGHHVSAFDGSIEMVRHASMHTGLQVAHLRFEDLDFNDEFDGVWASASLLHVPKDHLPHALEKLCHAMKLGGMLYLSMKHGTDEQCIEGRHFTFVDEAALQTLLDTCPELTPLRIWSSTEQCNNGSTQIWVHGLARRSTA